MATQRRKSGTRPADRAPTRHIEIETKLEVADDAPLPQLVGQKALAAAGLQAIGPEIVHELDAVYFDTSDLGLLRSKLTLRRRTGGDDAGWHLKLPAGSGARTEMRLPLSAGRSGTVPKELADLVRGAARGGDLVPVARLQNRRVVRHLLDADGGKAIEIADDHVTATPLREGAGPAERWRELEVEVVDGTREQLAAAVTVLRAAGARPASATSKLGRALPLPAAAPDLPRKSAGHALLAVLERQRELLVTADRAVRENVPTAIHDARRVARRIRSVLKVFAGLAEAEPARTIRSGLQDVSRILGAVRDLQIVRQRLDTQLSDEPEEYADHARRYLDVEIDRRCVSGRAEIRDALDSPAYLQVLRDLDALVDGRRLSARATRPAVTEFAAAITNYWSRLRTKASAALADPDNASAVHEVRKLAKTVRYATEAAVPVLGESAVLFAAAVEEIQEVLGEFQDACLAADLLVDLAGSSGTDGISGFVFGRLHAVEQALAHGAIDDFADAWDRVEDGDLVAQLGR